jgi:integral membrane protein
MDFFNLFKSELGRLRIIAFIEGTSFLAILFVTMPLKYWYGLGQPNKVIGLLHGIFFGLYLLSAFQAKIAENWGSKKFFIVLAASIIPFGTFWLERKHLNHDGKEFTLNNDNS